ncbi:MAG: hypothetical protein J6Z13_02850 [Clostridia bacterium]|nr:hypothetical protein [Clostridia bacterium]
MEKQHFELFIAGLYAKGNPTPLEKDVADTWKELQSNPFNAHSASQQILKNNLNHPDVFAAVMAKPTTVQKRLEDVDENDLKYNLRSQLELLVIKAKTTH